MRNNVIAPPPEYINRCPVCKYEQSGLSKLMGDLRGGLFEKPKCPKCGEKMEMVMKRKNPWFMY